MPHIRLTLSENASRHARLPHLMPELVDLLCRFETVDSAAVKAYWFVPAAWAMGAGAPEGFVHCEVSLLTGRPEVLRAQIADAFRDHLDDWFRRLIEEGEVGVTVEIREMDAATYRKTKRP